MRIPLVLFQKRRDRRYSSIPKKRRSAGAADLKPAQTLFDISRREEIEGDAPEKLLNREALFNLIPSWLVSFIFHLVMLIVLALLTLGADRRYGQVELEIAATDTVDINDFLEVEFEVEPTDFEQSTELNQEKEDFEDLEDVEDLGLDDLSDAGELEAGASGNIAERGSETARKPGGAKFFGAGADGQDFVFIIDCSGSMQDEYRWETAKKELKNAINGLTEKQRFVVFLYNNTAYTNSKKGAKLAYASKSNCRKTFKWLDSQYPIGDTRPWHAVRVALELNPDAMFFLSDGELRDPTVFNLRRANKGEGDSDNVGKIPIHTIFLGTGFGRLTMETIAKENNGTFTAAESF